MPETDAETIRQTVRETLLALGLDAEDPTELQRDMAFLRSWRGASEAVKRQGLVTATIVLVTGFFGLLWAFFRGPTP